MKKYYMSNVDFSEIINVTADAEQLERANERMRELGILTDKGNVSASKISAFVKEYSRLFFDKLTRRLSRRPDEFSRITNTLLMLDESHDNMAVFLYLAFIYGFLQWRVPESFSLMPANADALKLFVSEFTAGLKVYLEVLESGGENEESEDY